jgi:DNA-binding CsgD family transcriptional regulator
MARGLDLNRGEKSDAPTPEELVILREEEQAPSFPKFRHKAMSRAAIKTVLSRLTPKERKVFTLRARGVPQHEVGRRLGIKQPTVSYVERRIRRRLRWYRSEGGLFDSAQMARACLDVGLPEVQSARVAAFWSSTSHALAAAHLRCARHEVVGAVKLALRALPAHRDARYGQALHALREKGLHANVSRSFSGRCIMGATVAALVVPLPGAETGGRDAVAGPGDTPRDPRLDEDDQGDDVDGDLDDEREPPTAPTFEDAPW